MSEVNVIGPGLPVTVPELRSVFRRHGYHWKPKDIKKVCRQYLSGLAVANIAARHGRSPNAILYVLAEQGYLTPVPLESGDTWYVDTKSQSVVCKEIPVLELREYVRRMINVLQ